MENFDVTKLILRLNTSSKSSWFLNLLSSYRLYLDSAKHITNQSLFQEECVKQLRNNPPTLKTNEWKKLTNILLKNAEVTEPAEGTSTKDLLGNYLEDYCLNRIQKDKIDEIKTGGTFTDEGFHYLRFSIV